MASSPTVPRLITGLRMEREEFLRKWRDGILRSVTFPGLWLDTGAFWRIDRSALISTLERGLSGSGHTAFMRRLEAGRGGPQKSGELEESG